MLAATLQIGVLRAQDHWSEPGQDPRDPNLRAKAELANPEPEQGPVPEDNDPDIAKRPAFLVALGKKRMVGAAFESPIAQKFGRERLPDARIAQLSEWIVQVFQPAVTPGNVRILDWYGLGYQDRLTPDDRMCARWSAGDISFRVCSSIRDDTRGLSVQVRLLGEDRIEVRPFPLPGKMTEEDLEKEVELKDKWKYFDALQFYRLITKLFQVTFESPRSYQLVGGTGEFAGVPVFWGSIRSEYLRVPEHEANPRWFDELNVVVTDSDPQYLCMSISIPTP